MTMRFNYVSSEQSGHSVVMKRPLSFYTLSGLVYATSTREVYAVRCK